MLAAGRRMGCPSRTWIAMQATVRAASAVLIDSLNTRCRPMRVRFINVRLAVVAALSVLASRLAAQPVSLAAPKAGSTKITFNGLAHGVAVNNQFAGLSITGGACTANASDTYYASDV